MRGSWCKRNWIFCVQYIALVCLWIAAIHYVGVFIEARQKHHNQWFAKCIKDHKDYECEAMWRR